MASTVDAMDIGNVDDYPLTLALAFTINHHQSRDHQPSPAARPSPITVEAAIAHDPCPVLEPPLRALSLTSNFALHLPPVQQVHSTLPAAVDMSTAASHLCPASANPHRGECRHRPHFRRVPFLQDCLALYSHHRQPPSRRTPSDCPPINTAFA
ncbi:hypothetical protein BDZ89DRAFT_1158683 [Hymenopellis radicata]|nr:hypothetical protein BDZ89DRAFT_1158683 [Hymenopellis radicata]